MAKVDFQLDDIELRTNLAQFGPTVNKYITLTVDKGAEEGTRQMKLKAPWTDRTTNARNGLNAHPDHSGTSAIGFKKHGITFAHGVDYGIWLEVANSGKYQIIMPVVLAVGKEIMKTLDGLFSNLQGVPALHPTVDMPNARLGGTTASTRQRTGSHAATARTHRSGTTRRTRRS